MFFYRPDLAAPERLTLREAAWCAHRKISKTRDIQLAVRARRLLRLPEVCTGRHAAWGLVVAPYVVRNLIESGRLRAERILDERGGGRFRYVILPDDVRAIAEELKDEVAAVPRVSSPNPSGGPA